MPPGTILKTVQNSPMYIFCQQVAFLVAFKVTKAEVCEDQGG